MFALLVYLPVHHLILFFWLLLLLLLQSNFFLIPCSCIWSLVESVDPSDTLDGFHSFFPVRFNFVNSLNSLFVGDLFSNYIFVPIAFICIFTVSSTSMVRLFSCCKGCLKRYAIVPYLVWLDQGMI